MLPYMNMFATLPKSFREHGDHVFMIIEELLNEFAVASFCFLVFNLEDKEQMVPFKNRTETRNTRNVIQQSNKTEGSHPS